MRPPNWGTILECPYPPCCKEDGLGRKERRWSSTRLGCTYARVPLGLDPGADLFNGNAQHHNLLPPALMGSYSPCPPVCWCCEPPPWTVAVIPAEHGSGDGLRDLSLPNQIGKPCLENKHRLGLVPKQHDSTQEADVVKQECGISSTAADCGHQPASPRSQRSGHQPAHL